MPYKPINAVTPQQMVFPKMDFATLSSRFEKLDAMRNQVDEISNTIQQAISSYNLNPEDDAWKAQKAEDYRQVIQNAVNSGDVYYALKKATALAGDVMSDEELRGRARNNGIYQQKKNAILTNKNFSDITKRRWLEQNPYSSANLYDDNGKFVGGSEWQENWTPVEPLDKTKFYEDLKRIVAPEVRQSDSILYVDANGNYTSDPRNGVYGMGIKTTTGVTRIPASKYKAAFDALWKQYPNAQQALEQEYNDIVWEANNLEKKQATLDLSSPEYIANNERLNSLRESVTNREGAYITPEQYLKNSVYPVIDTMEVSDIRTSTTVGSGIENYNKARLQYAATQEARRNFANMQGVTEGMYVEEELKTTFAAANSTFESNLDQLASIVPFTKNKNSTFYKLIKQGKRDEAIKTLRSCLNSNVYNLNPYQLKQAKSCLNALTDNNKILEGLTTGMEKQDKAAIDFDIAFNSATPLPNAESNDYTKGILNAEKIIYGNSNYVDLRVQTDSDGHGRYEKILDYLQMTPAQLKADGHTIINDSDGSRYLRINRNGKYSRRILQAIGNTDDDFWHMPGNVSRFFQIKNGKRVEEPVSAITRVGNDAVYDRVPSNIINNIFNNIVERAESNSNTAATKAKVSFSRSPVMLLGNKGALDNTLFEQKLNGLISKEDYDERSKKNLEFKHHQVFDTPLDNFDVYFAAGEDTQLRKLNAADKKNLHDRLLECRDNKVSGDWQYGCRDGQYGVYITYGGKLDKDGKPISTDVENAFSKKTVWIPGLLSDEAEKAVANNTQTRTVRLMASLQHNGGQYTTDNGDIISNIFNVGTGRGATINGKEKAGAYEEAQRLILEDLDLKELEIYFYNAAINPNRTMQDVQQFNAYLEGCIKEIYPSLNPNSPGFALKKQEYVNTLQSRFIGK